MPESVLAVDTDCWQLPGEEHHRCAGTTCTVDQKARGRVQPVSRPPSSHITRVDEEESGGSDGRKSGARSVETVDRGVGPTPLPPPLAPGALFDHRLPTSLSFQPFPDPRNGLLEAAYAGLHYGYPHYPYSINAPLPLNPSTLEGRYQWPPASAFHQSLHGLPSSPAQSDVSLFSMRSPMVAGEPVTHLASRIHWEQLQRNYYHPFSGRRLNHAGLSGLPLGGASPLIGEYPPPPSLGGRSLFSDVPPTPGSGSITLPGSVESSRLNSPRPSITGIKSRKRALSHSPISDYLDIQSLTRSSEGSLHLAPFLQHNSRSSSAASGSYGHLSAASVGTVSPGHPILPSAAYLRPGHMAPSAFFYPHSIHPLLGRQHPSAGQGPMAPPGTQIPHPPHKLEPQSQISTTSKEPGSSSIVSSTMDGSMDMRKAKVKKEAENLQIASMDPDDDDDNYGERGSHIPQEGEPDFIETNCHWVDCHQEFETQDDLVKHINQDHIQFNKKSFVCRWTDCSREEKPFKAQYMLVVHMRRHTGEKPNRCTFEGCTKAYSRLENLKTHLRSHTGEKPYMCEFPGCTKAFSNASDRAKHQNRTHSNAKPYICKAIGCTKRYTDPSSLRKHVKTVHGADFYANKKHKGDGSCHVKKEDPDGDHDAYDANMRAEENLAMSGVSGPPSTDNRQSQDNMNSNPSSHSQPSPESSPEVNVTCGLGPDLRVTEDPIPRGGGNHIGGVTIEEEDVIIPESNEAEVPGSSALLMRRNQINAGQVMQNRLKGCIQSKTGSISPLPHLPNIISPGGNQREITQVSITELPQRPGQMKGSPQHKRIGDLVGQEQNSWRDTNSLLAGSRRESNSSTLSSYMSSMKSDTGSYHIGSTFSSRRSSGASGFSSRRSSGISARLSIANSPYEYDITGNLPNPVSRRSSGESSTNIGNVSALMQKASLGGQQANGALPNGCVDSSNNGCCRMGTGTASAGGGDAAVAAAAAVSEGGGGGQCGSSGGGSAGFGNSLATKYYNERLARYFSTRREMDGVRTSTPSHTLLLHEIPNREIRRASDPVRTRDPDFESLKRYHSLNVMKPLPTPTSMKSLQNKAGSNNFHSSRGNVGTDTTLPPGSSQRVKDTITEAELEEKMLEDSDDMIIPDDMQRFLNERYQGKGSNPDQSGDDNADLHTNDASRDAMSQGIPTPDLNFDPCDLLPPCENANEGDSTGFAGPGMNMRSHSATLLAGNLQVQTSFADLQHGAALTTRTSPGGALDQFQPSPAHRANFGPNFTNTWPAPDPAQNVDPGLDAGKMGSNIIDPSDMPVHGYNPNNDNVNDSSRVTCSLGPLHQHAQQQQQQPAMISPSPAAANNPGSMISGQRGPNPAVDQWMSGVAGGGGAYLSQHNLMQHQLAQQLQHQQQQQQQHAAFRHSSSSQPPYFHHHQYQNGQCVMLPPSSHPLGRYSPMPPPGQKPTNQRAKRSSPQVQVPLISQSQIPANAKAASRNQALMKQQQQLQQTQQQQQQMLSNRSPLTSPYPYPNMPRPDNPASKMYSNQNIPPSNLLPHPPPNPFPQHPAYSTPPYPPHPNNNNNVNAMPLPSPQPPPPHPSQMLNSNNSNSNHPYAIPSNQMPCSSHIPGRNPMLCANPQIPLGPHHSNTAPFHSSQLQNMSSPHPSLLANSAPYQGQGLPQHLASYPRGDAYNSMEMSPGCNQVTSSTDCKESTAPPIEDFMENLTSISTENLMDNINSISQENIAYSPVPMSGRTPSQNSGRYNALMSTSNMVVNDMSSVLTQLAEENKFLNMRP